MLKSSIFLLMFGVIITTVVAFDVSITRFPRNTVLKPFQSGKGLKVISGLNNFNIENVKNVVSAAEMGGATLVDIACRPDLVRIAKNICMNIPVCVSSVKPNEFVEAVDAGADMVEVGNYDSFYDKGIKFTAQEVLSLAMETRKLLSSIPLSVTIPHTLSLSEQVDLAKELEGNAVDVIQTEGKMSVVDSLSSLGVQELIERAAPTLASTYAISRAVSIPVICASGITDVTAPLAAALGAKGVGVGTMVNKLANVDQMYLAVRSIAEALGIQYSRSERPDLQEVSMMVVDAVSHQSKKFAVEQSQQLQRSNSL